MNCGLLQMVSALIAKDYRKSGQFFLLIHCVHLWLCLTLTSLDLQNMSISKLCKLNSFQTCSHLENDASKRCEILR